MLFQYTIKTNSGCDLNLRAPRSTLLRAAFKQRIQRGGSTDLRENQTNIKPSMFAVTSNDDIERSVDGFISTPESEAKDASIAAAIPSRPSCKHWLGRKNGGEARYKDATVSILNVGEGEPMGKAHVSYSSAWTSCCLMRSEIRVSAKYTALSNSGDNRHAIFFGVRPTHGEKGRSSGGNTVLSGVPCFTRGVQTQKMTQIAQKSAGASWWFIREWLRKIRTRHRKGDSTMFLGVSRIQVIPGCRQ